MITTKILKTAVGVQRGDVIDKTESTKLQNVTNGIIIGRFKRGRMDRPFKVTISNYQAVLGRDLSNPNFLIVQDALDCGAGEIWVMRIGTSVKHEEYNGLDFLESELERTLKWSDLEFGDSYTPYYEG